MSWGKGIILVFIAFAAFIGTLVTVCVKQEVNLVSKNYYEEELNYQQQIDALKNVAALENKPAISVSQKQVQVSGIQQGELKLVRPSDARYDATFMIDSENSFDLSKFPSGRYNASLRWQIDGKSYLIQESINL